MTEKLEIRPLQPVRRFDVFAETKRLEALAHGELDDVAKGYGIRIAKIVASRRFGGSKSKTTRHDKGDTSEADSPSGSRFGGEGGSKFRALNGEIQSDERAAAVTEHGGHSAAHRLDQPRRIVAMHVRLPVLRRSIQAAA